MQSLAKHKKLTVVLMAAVMMLSLTGLALANTSNGAEFASLYTTVLGWLTGVPAIIIAIAIALTGVVRAFQSGQFMWALAGLLVAALIFLLPGIIAGLGGATI